MKEYLFLKETLCSTIMATVRSWFDSLWVQLKKFSFLTGWPHCLENRQSWIIKIRGDFVRQVSLVLSERTLHEGQNYLLCDGKISGFRNWYIRHDQE